MKKKDLFLSETNIINKTNIGNFIKKTNLSNVSENITISPQKNKSILFKKDKSKKVIIRNQYTHSLSSFFETCLNFMTNNKTTTEILHNEDNIFFIFNKQLFKINKKNLKDLKKTSLELKEEDGHFVGMCALKKHLYITTFNGKIYCFNIEKDNYIIINNKFTILSKPIIDDNKNLYFLDLFGDLVKIDLNSGKRIIIKNLDKNDKKIINSDIYITEKYIIYDINDSKLVFSDKQNPKNQLDINIEDPNTTIRHFKFFDNTVLYCSEKETVAIDISHDENVYIKWSLDFGSTCKPLILENYIVLVQNNIVCFFDFNGVLVKYIEFKNIISSLQNFSKDKIVISNKSGIVYILDHYSNLYYKSEQKISKDCLTMITEKNSHECIYYSLDNSNNIKIYSIFIQ